jgi:hypothetical protein
MRENDFFEDDDYDIDIEMLPGDERQKKILKWLADSPLAEPVEGGSADDFFICQGSPVRLEGGFIVEAVSWLDSEGFDESLLIEGYTVSTEFLDNARGQAMIFRKREVIDAPFAFEDLPPFSSEDLEGTSGASDDPDDIPF